MDNVVEKIDDIRRIARMKRLADFIRQQRALCGGASVEVKSNEDSNL